MCDWGPGLVGNVLEIRRDACSFSHTRGCCRLLLPCVVSPSFLSMELGGFSVSGVLKFHSNRYDTSHVLCESSQLRNTSPFVWSDLDVLCLAVSVF